MLSCKKIPVLIVAITALSSCMEQRLLFDFERDVNRSFFKEIPGLGEASFIKFPVTKKAAKVEVYISSFSEKFVEKDRLLQFTELNDSTKIPFATYMGITGYSQDLYLLKYDFTYTGTIKKTGKIFQVPAKGAIFFSVKHNGRGDTIGITPCYFGIINEEDDLIAFDTKLSLKKDKSHYYRKLQKRNKKMNEIGRAHV